MVDFIHFSSTINPWTKKSTCPNSQVGQIGLSSQSGVLSVIVWESVTNSMYKYAQSGNIVHDCCSVVSLDVCFLFFSYVYWLTICCVSFQSFSNLCRGWRGTSNSSISRWNSLCSQHQRWNPTQFTSTTQQVGIEFCPTK